MCRFFRPMHVHEAITTIRALPCSGSTHTCIIEMYSVMGSWGIRNQLSQVA